MYKLVITEVNNYNDSERLVLVKYSFNYAKLTQMLKGEWYLIDTIGNRIYFSTEPEEEHYDIYENAYIEKIL